MSKVIDCFTLFNELDVLRIRLEELYEVVDKFVIVEANKTHSVKDKPYNFEENKEKFSKFLDKIVYVKVEDFPVLSPWPMEFYQRNCILRGLEQVQAKAEDIVLMSDLDEIPRSEIVRKIRELPLPVCFEHDHSSIYLNRITKDPKERIWRGTVVAKMIDFVQYPPQVWRDEKHKLVPVKNGGWHFSYCGGLFKVKEKLKSFCHIEYADIANDPNLEDRIKNHKDLLNREGGETIIIPIDETFPVYIQHNQEKLSHLIEPYELR